MIIPVAEISFPLIKLVCKTAGCFDENYLQHDATSVFGSNFTFSKFSKIEICLPKNKFLVIN